MKNYKTKTKIEKEEYEQAILAAINRNKSNYKTMGERYEEKMARGSFKLLKKI